MTIYLFAGIAFWACAAGAVYCLRPRSRIHTAVMEAFDRRRLAITLAVMLAVILLCTLPMSLSPYWNGEIVHDNDQYEKITEAFLNGHLYFDDEVDPRLLAMENPYDTTARNVLGVKFHWDHAFYNGRYYMYFGVVPVILLFLPFRLLTGMTLAAYHATQIFIAAFICGVFALFYLLCRKYFRSMTFASYLALSVAFSALSSWYCAATPSMYCTAISSGICMEIWSLYFFVRAVYIEPDERRSLRLAFFGSLFGALAFGCRPPVALANLLVLPLLAKYLHDHPLTFKRFWRLALAAAPYFVIGALLMLYNYLRFDSPFEFGQTYQLTSADQSGYGVSGSGIARVDMLNAILLQLFRPPQLTHGFPYVTFQGIFANFPILLIALYAAINKAIRAALRRLHLTTLYLSLLVCVLVIMASEVIYSPGFIERYNSDVYWLLCLAAFLIFGCQSVLAAGETEDSGAPAKLSSRICLCALLTLVLACLYFFVPNDSNFASISQEFLSGINRVLRLGKD